MCVWVSVCGGVCGSECVCVRTCGLYYRNRWGCICFWPCPRLRTCLPTCVHAHCALLQLELFGFHWRLHWWQTWLSRLPHMPVPMSACPSAVSSANSSACFPTCSFATSPVCFPTSSLSCLPLPAALPASLSFPPSPPPLCAVPSAPLLPGLPWIVSEQHWEC